jgi:hypothetical protein
MVWQVTPHKCGDIFAAFLDQIAELWPLEDLVLVMDNLTYHRAPAVRTWCAAQTGRIVPFWLPAYTPTRYLIERIWRFLKQKLACHRFWADAAGLEAAAAALLDHSEAHFHTDTRPGIRLVNYFCEPA